MKTTVMKPAEVKRFWHLVDLKDQTLGRVATQIASLLIGKNKLGRSTHVDNGDYVVCVNAKLIHVTGNKVQDKLYQGHSGIPGGFKEINFADLLEKDPRKIIIHAVKGMLPKNKHRDLRLKRLKVFSQPSHPYNDKFHQLNETKKEE